MKIINLDELELKCIEWGIKNKLFTKEDLKDKNLFTINLNGRYHSKTCDLSFKSFEQPITISADTWEDLYYKIDDFFRNIWDYTNPIDINKAPLYMQITEELKKKSLNNVVKLSDVHQVLTEKL